MSPIIYPPLAWATDIQVSEGDGQLHVTGVRAAYLSRTPTNDSDLWHQYMHASPGQEPPHLMFFNAGNDSKLVQFVERFGPVVAATYEESGDTRKAVQFWSELREEQRTYRAAMRLMEAARDSKPDPRVIREHLGKVCDGIALWPHQHRREDGQRKAHKSADSSWVCTSPMIESFHHLLWQVDSGLSWARHGHPFRRLAVNSPYRVACQAICKLVNVFPAQLEMWGDSAIEFPAADMDFGVRPALYAMLRREFLGSRGIRICKDEQCGRMFELTHGSQEYCPHRDCEQRHRQRRYWSAKGAEKRRQRIARKKAI